MVWNSSISESRFSAAQDDSRQGDADPQIDQFCARLSDSYGMTTPVKNGGYTVSPPVRPLPRWALVCADGRPSAEISAVAHPLHGTPTDLPGAPQLTPRAR